MVRLLLFQINDCPFFATAFQSHNGAIAASGGFNQFARDVHLSIPQWCDCCLYASSFTSPSACFQSHNGAIAADAERMISSFARALSIPQWCDCCQTVYPTLHNCSPLSIPQWCDCCSSISNAVILTSPFQSHNGAIAAASGLIQNPALPFQSHNGAIAAVDVHRCCGRKPCTFNPTMVRLLLYRSKLNRCANDAFNPTMVRLLLVAQKRLPTEDEIFQSHNGAIAAWRG